MEEDKKAKTLGCQMFTERVRGGETVLLSRLPIVDFLRVGSAVNVPYSNGPESLITLQRPGNPERIIGASAARTFVSRITFLRGVIQSPIRPKRRDCRAFARCCPLRPEHMMI